MVKAMSMIIILAGFVPSSSQIIGSDNYFSTLDILKPDILSEYFLAHVDELLLLDFTEMLGQTKPATQTSYSHYEAPQLMSYITVIGQSDPGAGQPATYTLQHDCHLDSGTTSYVRLNDQIILKNGVTGIVTALDNSTPYAHTFTAYPYSDTATFGVTTTGDAMTVYTNNWAEGTGGSTSLTYVPIKFTNNCQIVKDFNGTTGSAMTDETWFEVEGVDGEIGYLYFYEDERNAYRRMRVFMELNTVLGVNVTNTALLAMGHRGSEGIINYALNKGGISYPYNQGQWTINDTRKLINQLDANGTYANEYMWIQGMQFNQEVEQSITTVMQNGAVTYAGFDNGKGMNTKDVAIAIGFNSIYLSGYTLHMKRYRPFNHQTLLGIPGFNYTGMGIGIPMGRTVDARTGKPVPFFRSRTKENGGYNRGMEHWVIAGAGNGPKYTDIDERGLHYRSEAGFEGFAAPMWFINQRS